MIIVEYDADCQHGAIPDGQAKMLAEFIADHYEGNWTFSTENIFGELRCLVKDGTITHDEIVFRFKGEDLTIGRDGSVSQWPKGFCDHTLDYLLRLTD